MDWCGLEIYTIIEEGCLSTLVDILQANKRVQISIFPHIIIWCKSHSTVLEKHLLSIIGQHEIIKECSIATCILLRAMLVLG